MNYDVPAIPLADWRSSERLEQAGWAPLHLLDGHFEERPISVQSYLRGCYRAGHGQAAVETIGSKRSYALTWCMPNNDDDNDDDDEQYHKTPPAECSNYGYPVSIALPLHV